MYLPVLDVGGGDGSCGSVECVDAQDWLGWLGEVWQDTWDDWLHEGPAPEVAGPRVSLLLHLICILK